MKSYFNTFSENYSKLTRLIHFFLAKFIENNSVIKNGMANHQLSYFKT